MLPSYFSAFFGHVLSPPVINWPLPPIAPMPPIPRMSFSLDDPRASMTIRRRSSPPPPSDPFSDTFRGAPSLMERVSSSTTRDSTDSDCPCTSSRSITFVQEEGTSIGGGRAVELFPTLNTSSLDEHTLFLQLRTSVCRVLSAKEAMWDELKERIERDRESLGIYGWESTDFEEAAARQIFDALIERYRE